MSFKIKNNTAVSIYIDTVGLSLLAGEEKDLTGFYTDSEIQDSIEIQQLIQSGDLTINSDAPPLLVVIEESQSTVTEWTDKALLTLPNHLFGKYWISWYAEVSPVGNQLTDIRIYNKTIDVVIVGPLQYGKSMKGLGEQWQIFTGFTPLETNLSQQEVAIQFKVNGVGDTLKFKNTNMRYTKDRFV